MGVTMKALRTPDERFADLPGYAFEAHYVEVDAVRVHSAAPSPRPVGHPSPAGGRGARG